jgi:patatin-like phospholipase/acyl hydrolase
LSIDGGGIRALLPALILVELEKSSGKQLKYMFDMICGTSTGALLGALISLAPEIDLVKFFTENIRDIYGDKTGEGDLCSSEKLEAILKGVFGERKFISVNNEPNLVIPTSTDSSQHPEVHVFDSCSAATKLNYADITIVDVLMATMASPGFFKPHTIGRINFILSIK